MARKKWDTYFSGRRFIDTTNVENSYLLNKCGKYYFTARGKWMKPCWILVEVTTNEHAVLLDTDPNTGSGV